MGPVGKGRLTVRDVTRSGPAAVEIDPASSPPAPTWTR